MLAQISGQADPTLELNYTNSSNSAESAGFNRTQVLKSLRGTAVPLNGSAWDPASGHGLADVAAAYASGGN